MRRLGLLALALVLVSALPAIAQSPTTGSVNGTISDNTNAVLPGVTVTASGPAIMGVQTAVSNEQGQYRFPALPPGSYKLTYELTGFSTVVREGIIVGVGFAATVNVQLTVATLQETVTVTGASPVVDVQNTNTQTNFTQDMIKSLPNARDIWALIAVAPGTTMSQFDVGGSRAGTQTGYQAYGRGGQVRVQVDGANSTEDTGGTGYFNYGAWEEVSIGTDSNDASMPTPGVQINAVVKSGGNQLRGDLYLDFQHESMQGNNVTDALRRLGVGEGARVTKYYDPNLGIGGPIRKDKLWYFVSLRDQRSGTTVTGFPAEAPGKFDFLTKLENVSYKVTYQLNPNNKFSQFFEMRRKLQPSRGASSTTYSDAIFKQESISAYGSAEWNRIVTPTFFFNARTSTWGYNWPNYAYGTDGLEQNIQPRQQDELTGNQRGGAIANRTYRRRYQFDWTGTLFRDDWLGSNHGIKMGFTAERETERITTDGYLDEVRLRFDSRANGIEFSTPWRVELFNTPRRTINNLQHQGAYVQDQINLRQGLTLNAGVRWDAYHVYYPDQDIRESRFRDFFYAGAPLPNGYALPVTPYSSFKIPGRDNIIKFTKAFGPRLGLAWDIRGNGKTVAKANWGRYWSNPGPQDFVNPMQGLTWTFAWNDLNRDRLFQINEVGAFVSSAGATNNTISPDLKQEYTDDISVFLERELITDLSLRAGWVMKEGKNNWQSVQVGRLYSMYSFQRTFADPGPDGIAGTGDDGPPLVAYDFPPGVTIPPSRTDLRTVPSIESSDKNIDVTINKRMSNHWSLLASFLYNWDHTKGAPQTPNAERFNELDLTGWAFKMFGTYQAPWGIVVNPVLRHQSGDTLSRVVQVSLRTGTLDYQAEAPGTYREPNITIFDLAAEKRFPIGQRRDVSVFFAAFNVMNSNAATGQDQIVGTRTAVLPSGERLPYQRFLRPTGILPPRIYRIGMKLAF
ncbi:MAG: TonB-dependent receptor [Acidobacteria bacterium]|nr:TonB-dependent receptor [Acidobacteriota bacterium]